MIKMVVEVWRKRAVLRHFVSVQLTTSYRTKTFGFLWALLNPLLFMCVYYFVFGTLIAHRPLWFMLHIYMGIISFRFLTGSITQSAHIIKGNAGLIREIAFPKAVLPLSVVITRFFDLVVGCVGAIIIGYAFHVNPTPLWALVPAFLLVQLVFVLGASYLTAYVGVFFADIENFLEVGTRLWFYLSPVLYPLSDVAKRVKGKPLVFDIYLANPMTGILVGHDFAIFMNHPALLTSFQDHNMELFYPGVFILRSLLAGVVVLVIGLYVFSRAEGQIGKYV